MYKVLLADDERLDLEGMRTFIPWEELGMEVVAAVPNGFAAAKVLEEEHVDILVTDVRMPNMTGLELAQRALDKGGDLKIVFVSGYQDFHYAKQALALNAVDYVLKPMDDQELVEALRKVRRALDQERKQRETYGRMVPVVLNEYVLQLLEGTMTEDVAAVLEEEFGLSELSWPQAVAVLEIDRLFSGEGDGEGRMNDLLQAVLPVCREQGIRLVSKTGPTRLAVVVEAAEAERAALRLIGIVKEQCPFTITAGVGAPADRLSELRGSYEQAAQALAFKMFRGKGKAIRYEDVQTTEIEDVKRIDVRLEALLEAMSNYDLVRVHDELDALFQAARNLKSSFTLRNFALTILMKLDGYLHSVNEDLFSLLGLELENLDVLLQFETIDEIHSWLRRRSYELSERLYAKKQKRNWKLIQDIIEHVRDRMQESVTLKDVAERLSFSPNYLGHLFKEETGKNFSEYVIDLRMEKAAELLKTTNLKIYEIADRVGYRYLPYFSRQFKENYGMTPLEYRKS